MPVDLRALVAPAQTAVVLQEVQRGVVGPGSVLPQLAEAAQPVLANLARLLPAARTAGASVVHCIAAFRPDRKGAGSNAPLFVGVSKQGGDARLVAGSDDVLPAVELGAIPDGDLVSTRWTGVGPAWDTGLIAMLTNLGVRTVIATGVSVNVGVTNLVMDCVNAGFSVVVPRDAVAGVPNDYADAVIDNTLRLLATVTTTGKILEAWT
ncbi:MAG TPA: isochorismatase family protein [Mycobacteriales bacterium]|nr:isochorismatase family protein [Mycobacteriales bacterium]